MKLDRSHTIRQCRYLTGDQEKKPGIIDVLLLENVKEQKRNTIRSVKLNKVLHSGIFK